MEQNNGVCSVPKSPCGGFRGLEITTLAMRLSILYVLISITQVIFYFYNHALLGEISLAELPNLVRGALVFDTISIVYINCLFIVLSLLPLRVRAHKNYQKVLFWIFIVSNSLAIIVLNVSDIVYYSFTQKRFTFEEFHFLRENTNNAGILWQAVLENWWLAAVCAVLIGAMVWSYKKIPNYNMSIKKHLPYYALNTVILCAVIYLCVGAVRGGFGHGVRPYTLSNAVNYTQTPQKANLILSNPFCVLRTMRHKGIDVPQYFSEEELAQIFSPFHSPQRNSKNIGKKNVVLFILESFSKEHSKFYSPEVYQNHSGFTPFLDSLMQHGYVFTNAFSNGLKSIEALPSILASIPSFETSFVLLPQSLSTINGLPRMLAQKGYTTSFFCGADKNSMGFEAIASQVGISQFFTREDYEKSNPVNKNTVEPLWGVFDMPFFQFMADELATMPEPFFATVFNLTSHHPFVIPPDYQNKLPKGFTKVQQPVAYTDRALQKLFARIKNEPWYKNTIFVFIADHPSSERYSDYAKTPKGSTAILYFIYTPSHELQGTHTQVTQQLDVMPTLLGLLGNTNPYFAFGRDVFNDTTKTPIAVNYINQLYQSITDEATYYFDKNSLLMAYSAGDTLQKQNIVNKNTERQQQAETYTRALLQSYYSQLARKNFIFETH
ncbi:MAG: sulfatase-like hydrolase/transferase [Bacteroidetes bacterium]|nr:sulfatase-like hydrolase/transferase [Bacteroidota bacterium]